MTRSKATRAMIISWTKEARAFPIIRFWGAQYHSCEWDRRVLMINDIEKLISETLNVIHSLNYMISSLPRRNNDNRKRTITWRWKRQLVYNLTINHFCIDSKWLKTRFLIWLRLSLDIKKNCRACHYSSTDLLMLIKSYLNWGIPYSHKLSSFSVLIKITEMPAF